MTADLRHMSGTYRPVANSTTTLRLVVKGNDCSSPWTSRLINRQPTSTSVHESNGGASYPAQQGADSTSQSQSRHIAPRCQRCWRLHSWSEIVRSANQNIQPRPLSQSRRELQHGARTSLQPSLIIISRCEGFAIQLLHDISIKRTFNSNHSSDIITGDATTGYLC